MNIDNFIKAQGITGEFEPVDENPNMPDMPKGSRHWRVTIRNAGGEEMQVYYSMGPALDEEPTLGEILECLTIDAIAYENTEDFWDWMSELGFDVAEGRKAERIYRVVGEQAEELKNLLGEDAYYKMLYEI